MLGTTEGIYDGDAVGAVGILEGRLVLSILGLSVLGFGVGSMVGSRDGDAEVGSSLGSLDGVIVDGSIVDGDIVGFLDF